MLIDPEQFGAFISAGSTARLDRTANGAFLITETGPGTLWNEVNGESQTIWLDEPHDAPTWHLPS